ncbi:MAG: glycosyltransferase family 2 protein [Bacteroidales bacterium]|nr:glycosyltransferase family 2 protein [Bacteroidales bacterium]
MPRSKINSFPLVSIVTVNFNQAETTIELIESLNQISYPNIEIIVVDNASEEEDSEIIKEKYPRIKLIKSVINYGFAGGNNLGIMQARGEFVLLLNNDIIVEPHFLEPLVKKLIDEPEYGSVSPKIRYYYRDNILQYAGFTEINKWTIRNKTIGQDEVDQGQYDMDYDTAYSHGAAMLVPMKVIKKVGMMSYEFFLYYEEADWCMRMRNAGYKIGYMGHSMVYHKGSVTVGKSSALRIHYLTRNRLVFMRRNIHGLNFFGALIYQLLIAIGKNGLIYLLKGKTKLMIAYWSGILWNAKNMFNKEIHSNPYL